MRLIEYLYGTEEIEMPATDADRTRNDRLTMRSRLQQRYRYAAPPGAGTVYERAPTMSGNPLSIAPLRRKLRDGAQRYAIARIPLLDAKTSRRLRVTCDAHDRAAAEH